MGSHKPRPVTARGEFDLRKLAGEAGLVVGSALLANLIGYLFHFIISRRIGPDQYGTLVAMLAIFGIIGVIGQALNNVAVQETAKLWVLHRDDHIAAFVRHAAPAALGVGAVVGLGILVASLPLGPYLHITRWDLWIAFAAFCMLNVVASFLRGAAQGAHRFGYFAASLLGESIVKLILALVLVAIGWQALGALGGFAGGIAFGAAILLPPFQRIAKPATYDVAEHDHLRLGGESSRVLGVSVCTAALMFVDTIFAKHHLTGVDAGYYGAAGTIARIIPYGVGLIGLILLPKAAAAQHASRSSLMRLLAVCFGAGLLVTGVVVAVLVTVPKLVIAVSYGATYAGAIPLLRLYGIDQGLLGACGLGFAYLIAVRDYRIGRFLIVAVALEAVLMALFGTTAVRLLTTAIIVNGLLLPAVAFCVWQALRDNRAASELPQAVMPPIAEV